jgi:hypothetical protein
MYAGFFGVNVQQIRVTEKNLGLLIPTLFAECHAPALKGT